MCRYIFVKEISFIGKGQHSPTDLDNIKLQFSYERCTDSLEWGKIGQVGFEWQLFISYINDWSKKNNYDFLYA